MSNTKQYYQHSRLYPAPGLLGSSLRATIAFVTVCTQRGQCSLASEENKNILHDIWKQERNAFAVGYYLLMFDHLHLFCSPKASASYGIERWVGFWKSEFNRRVSGAGIKWQRGVFHHRIRSSGQYQAKLCYVENNPVRKGYVSRPEEWPYQGQVHSLEWWSHH